MGWYQMRITGSRFSNIDPISWISNFSRVILYVLCFRDPVVTIEMVVTQTSKKPKKIGETLMLSLYDDVGISRTYLHGREGIEVQESICCGKLKCGGAWIWCFVTRHVLSNLP